MTRDRAPSVPEPEPDAVRYAAAVAEIEQLLASIDRDEVDLDELSTKIERAVNLLAICRAKLKATEARVTEVLKNLARDEEAAAEADTNDAESAAASSAEATFPKRAKRRKKPDPSDDPGAASPDAPKSPPSNPPITDDELPF